jgi:signal peptidase I
VVRAVTIALVGLFGAILLVLTLSFDGYVIRAASMAPTLEPGDRVLARSVSIDDLSRGDVVVFQRPPGAGEGPESFVTRVVALAGDEVGDGSGFLSVNGARVDEPYLAPGTVSSNLTPVKVPAGHVFVMGDNRPFSFDSRRFGPLPTSLVRKLVVARYWPPGDLGGV